MSENLHRDHDEVTLKELILKIKELIGEVKNNWFKVLVVSILCIVAFVYKHKNHVPEYSVQLRFVVEGQSGGGGLSSLLGTFGIKKGGNVNPYKVIEVGKSTNILLGVLSQKLESGEILANALLDRYELNEKWSVADSSFESFKFKSDIDTNDDKQQSDGLKRIRTLIWGKANSKKPPLITFSLNDDTGIYTLETNSIDEEISLELTKRLYDKIKFFFEDEVFANQKQLADILSAKADSINFLIASKLNELAKFDDRNRGVVNNQTLVRRKMLTQENLGLSVAYAEILKSKEMTDVNLKDLQPLFMSIDTPFSPVSPTISSLTISIIKGLSIGLFLSFIIIVFRKIYNDIMSD
tara:strand:- start:423 stop:1481 length:1059 start_codon:yes stop_codon:yes gene_type:complete